MVCDEVIDSYSENNVDAYYSFDAAGEGGAQALTNSGAHTLCAAKFYLRYLTDNDFTFRAELYACSGTPGVNGIPTGGALAVSDTHNGSELTTTAQLITFDFSGDEYDLLDGGNYCIAVMVLTLTSGKLQVGMDNSSPTHSGNAVKNIGTWVSESSRDVCFYIYEAPAAKIPVFQRQYRARRVA